MTTALYRRYRPDTFQDVIGQEHVTAPLMAALGADRVTHAYLFSGPRGCGKTTSARILARCLNCEQYPTDTPCGHCPSCRDLATGGPGSLDVVEIDAASHNGVDDARDLRERASFAPARDRFKIFILDEAHMVTPQGFNALLKLVEEPPAHVKFIFATTEPEKVIGTIRSRTHHYPFRLVPPDTLEAYLAHLCEAEQVRVGPGVFPLVTRAGGGSVRDTLSVMDQLMGGAVDGTVDYQRAVALLGYTDTTMLDQCVDAIAAADGAGVFRVIDRVISSGHDPRRFVEDLLQRLRDLLVIALAGAQAGPALGSLPEDEWERMSVQARTLGSGVLSRYADMTASALTQMVGATSPRLQLELLMARLLVPTQVTTGAGPTASIKTSSPRLTAVRGGDSSERPGQGRALAAQIARQTAGGATRETPTSSSGPASPPAAAMSTPGHASASDGGASGHDELVQDGTSQTGAAPGPVRNTTDEPSTGRADAPAAPQQQTVHREPTIGCVESADLSGMVAPGGEPACSGDRTAASDVRDDGAAEAEMIRARWAEVVESAKRARRVTWALVSQHAQPGALNDGVFQVRFAAPGLVATFDNGGHALILAEAIRQALGLSVEVHAVLADDDPHAGPPSGPSGGTTPGNPPSPRSDLPNAPQPPSATGRQPNAPSGDSERTVQSAAEPPSHPSSRPEPEPQSAPATPEPVGWGDVAPIGRARRHDADSEDQIGEASRTDAPTQVAPVEAVASYDQCLQVPAGSVDGDACAQSGGSDGHQSSDSVVLSRDTEDEETPAPGPALGSAAVSGAARSVRPEPPVVGVSVPSASVADMPSDQATTPAVTSANSTVLAQSTAAPDMGQPLATVHRLHALPTLPDVAASSANPSAQPAQVVSAESEGMSPVSVAAAEPTPAAPSVLGQSEPAATSSASSVSEVSPPPATFSDGTPVPDEPGELDGPEDTWPLRRDVSPEAVNAAIQAARAAARGERLPAEEMASQDISLEDDIPSEDDDDAEEAGVVGLEVVTSILGATVLEEIIVNPEER